MKTMIGLQGSVMGYDDPWAKKGYRRTGEGMDFPTQDKNPKKEEIIKFIKQMGLDFFLKHTSPDKDDIEAFINDMIKNNMPFFLGNEVGQINFVSKEGTNRYDFPLEIVKKYGDKKEFLGIVYDESEHLQMHPKQYIKDDLKYQWVDPKDMSLDQIRDKFIRNVKDVSEEYTKVDLYCESVFPTMAHNFSKGKINPMPKILKEEFTPIALSISLGAAVQYKRKFAICIDLWGFDVGNWFTRLWGFPAHSPREYKNALTCAYLHAPDFMFTENIDPLCRYEESGFELTEFGKILKEYTKEIKESDPLPYTYKDAKCKVAVIRSDDGAFSSLGTLNGDGYFGSSKTKVTNETASFFEVMYLLSHKKISKQSLNFFNSELDAKWNAAKFGRDEEALKKLPLKDGVSGYESKHPLFYPLDSVLVFDENVKKETLEGVEKIIVCGSKITAKLKNILIDKVENGCDLLIASWLASWLDGENIDNTVNERKNKNGSITVTSDFMSFESQKFIEKCLGKENEWTVRFKDYEIVMTNTKNDGIEIDYEINKISNNLKKEK